MMKKRTLSFEDLGKKQMMAADLMGAGFDLDGNGACFDLGQPAFTLGLDDTVTDWNGADFDIDDGSFSGYQGRRDRDNQWSLLLIFVDL